MPAATRFTGAILASASVRSPSDAYRWTRWIPKSTPMPMKASTPNRLNRSTTAPSRARMPAPQMMPRTVGSSARAVSRRLRNVSHIRTNTATPPMATPIRNCGTRPSLSSRLTTGIPVSRSGAPTRSTIDRISARSAGERG